MFFIPKCSQKMSNECSRERFFEYIGTLGQFDYTFFKAVSPKKCKSH
jgi:hypothetical protein